MDYTIIFCIFEDYIYSIFIMRFPCHTCSLYASHAWSVQTTCVECTDHAREAKSSNRKTNLKLTLLTNNSTVVETTATYSLLE